MISVEIDIKITGNGCTVCKWQAKQEWHESAINSMITLRMQQVTMLRHSNIATKHTTVIYKRCLTKDEHWATARSHNSKFKQTWQKYHQEAMFNHSFPNHAYASHIASRISCHVLHHVACALHVVDCVSLCLCSCLGRAVRRVRDQGARWVCLRGSSFRQLWELCRQDDHTLEISSIFAW